TDRAGRIRLREPHSVSGQAVEMQRAMIPAAVTPQIRPPQIIGHDQDDVGRGVGTTRRADRDRPYRECENNEPKFDPHSSSLLYSAFRTRIPHYASRSMTSFAFVTSASVRLASRPSCRYVSFR